MEVPASLEPLLHDAAFAAWLDRQGRAPLLSFLLDEARYRSALLQPLGQGPALGEALIAHYMADSGSRVLAEVAPATRAAVCAAWGKGRPRATAFDSARAAVVAALCDDAVLGAWGRHCAAREKEALARRAALPLHVRVSEGTDDALRLHVRLEAAGTLLEWDVERRWRELQALRAALRRYGDVPVLPPKLLGAQVARVQSWLDAVCAHDALAASKEVYHFLDIGKTVQLLSGKAAQQRAARAPTRAVEETESAATQTARLPAEVPPPSPPGEPSLLVVSDEEALDRALEKLQLLDPEPGSVRACKTGRRRDGRTSPVSLTATDIEQALQHLMQLQFTARPVQEDPDDEFGDDGGDSEDEGVTDSAVTPSPAGTDGSFRHTRPLDTPEYQLHARMAQQAVTIEAQAAEIAQLRARVRSLEAQLAAVHNRQ